MKMTRIDIDAVVYSLEAVMAAAYVLSDDFFITIRNDARRKRVVVSCKPKSIQSAKKIHDLRDVFFNELLRYQLRVHIGRRNKKIREYIVAKALYPFENTSPDTVKHDPLGIMIPWEDSHKAEAK